MMVGSKGRSLVFVRQATGFALASVRVSLPGFEIGGNLLDIIGISPHFRMKFKSPIIGHLSKTSHKFSQCSKKRVLGTFPCSKMWFSKPIAIAPTRTILSHCWRVDKQFNLRGS
jgi:hypothetical protein